MVSHQEGLAYDGARLKKKIEGCYLEIEPKDGYALDTTDFIDSKSTKITQELKTNILNWWVTVVS